jgi:hypothetical protein
MGLADLSSGDAIAAAMDEFDRIGESAFLERYGFGPARTFLVVRDGKRYPSKAIAGVAHGKQFPDKGPLTSEQIRGGERIVAKLEELGYRSEPVDGSAAVWLIRAGQLGEAERHCLDLGLCGIGWPELPSLEGLGPEEIDATIESVYSGDLAGRIANSKVQIRDFMAMRPGDLVLMPLKSNKGFVAVGEVVGGYEHRPDLPDVLRHVRRTDWISDAHPRELFEPISRWLNRPPTVARVPVVAGAVLSSLAAEAPIRVSDAPASSEGEELREVFEEVLGQMASGEGRAEVERLLTRRAPAPLRQWSGERRPVTVGLGMGTPADVPWIALHSPGAEGTAQVGYYVVYLFAVDGSAVYLSLIQGTEKMRGGLKPLWKRAEDLRVAAGLETAGDPIDLGKAGGRPAKYEAGSAYVVRYEAGAVPRDEELRADLERVLAASDAARAAGLELDPEVEPLHLLFKWSSEAESETISLHREVAEREGSVWWGKFGSGPNPISAAKLKQVQDQLERGVLTHAYLYGRGTGTRTRLEEITVDPDEVDEARRPDYYEKEGCNLFVRLSGFEPLGADWLAANLALASHPEPGPDKMQGALSNQTTPLFVFERFVKGEGTPSVATVLDKRWLSAQTLWAEADLEELLEAVDEEGQVILAGPPGTGKTWIAERVARYLTQDEAMRVKTVQLHPSWGYEEFVEGLRPVVGEGGAIAFRETPGVVRRAAKAAEGSDGPYVLIVDELNRANLPRVFGELLYLLEYRDKEIDLQLTPQFSLPENLKLIATMNTADRSIRGIDVALRRRFEIFECYPSAEALERYYAMPEHSNAVSGLVEGFEKLNAELAESLDRHHTIGQSYFMREKFTTERLRRVWRRQVLPLIEDYFFDQPDLLERFTRDRYWPGT